MKIRLLARQTSVTPSENDDDQERLIKEAEQLAAQKSLQRELEFEQDMLLDREQRIRQIEGDILDVNEIMRELGAMVYEQGDAISKLSNQTHIFKYHVFAPIGKFQLELIYLYFPPSFHLTVVVPVL